MFTTIARLEDGQKVKILQRVNREQANRFTVQVVELYRYNGLPIENKTYTFATLDEARAFYEKAFDVLTLSAQIEKAEGILKRLRAKIRSFESMNDDFAPRGWIRAERKVRQWLERHIPRKAVERRDWMDCYL